MPLGPTARKAWEALKSAGGTGLDVLAAPGKGAAATLRYATTGEEPRLEPGSSWRIAGPGLGEMAAEGYGMAGDVLGKELYPETEGLDTSGVTRAAEALMTVPFGAALEGVPQAALASSGLHVAGSLKAARTPLARFASGHPSGVPGPPRGPLNIGVKPRARGELLPNAGRAVVPEAMFPTVEHAMQAGNQGMTAMVKGEDAYRGARDIYQTFGSGTVADEIMRNGARMSAAGRDAYRAAGASIEALGEADRLRSLAATSHPYAYLFAQMPGISGAQVAGGTAYSAAVAAQRSEEEARR